MRRLALLVPLLTLGCGQWLVDPCRDVVGSCLAVQVDPTATVTEVETLALQLSGDGVAAMRVVGSAGVRQSLPIAVGVQLGAIARSSARLTLQVSGSLGGQIVGHDSLTVSLSSGQHQTVHVRLSGGAPLDPTTADMAAPELADLASSNQAAPDLAHDMGVPVESCVPTLAGCAGLTCGQADDGCGGVADCGACQLLAVAPALAASGATLTLEGTFGASASVTFPGGVVQPATVLGPHRATVVVPAAAGAGGLTLTTNRMTVGPLPFRRATFPLGLGLSR